MGYTYSARVIRRPATAAVAATTTYFRPSFSNQTSQEVKHCLSLKSFFFPWPFLHRRLFFSSDQGGVYASSRKHKYMYSYMYPGPLLYHFGYLVAILGFFMSHRALKEKSTPPFFCLSLSPAIFPRRAGSFHHHFATAVIRMFLLFPLLFLSVFRPPVLFLFSSAAAAPSQAPGPAAAAACNLTIRQQRLKYPLVLYMIRTQPQCK
jgi:hypothetical protein